MLKELEDQNYIRNKIFDKKKSQLKKYSELVIGEGSFWKLVKFELITTVFGPIPGAMGLFLRKIFYPKLFKKVGHKVIFGQNIVIRNANNIELGDNVILDDYCVIDARGAGEKGIKLGDQVIINRNSSIQAKLGEIHIGANTDIGMFSVVHSQGAVYIGEMVTLGGGCKISGGKFQISRSEGDTINSKESKDSFNVREQVRTTAGPIKIGNKCILGMGCLVLDGVKIGDGSVIGAGSVVNKDIPDYTVAAGVPVKVLRNR